MRAILSLAIVAAGLLAIPVFAAPVSMPPAGDGLALSRLLQPVQGRACRACRLDCSAERNYCGYGEGCQRRFVLCMRGCWEDYCR